MAGLLTAAMAVQAENVPTPEWQVIGWNDLGMHCMDGTDFSVFSILPPFNTVNAQVLHNGQLVTDPEAAGLSVQYRGVADPQGSINTTSADKVNFWHYMEDFFGVTLPDDLGLFGAAMPGAANLPQDMHFNSSLNWFSGEGIPLTPFDDAGHVNYYPLMQLELHNSSDTVLASTRVVLPVSDEMDCSVCHQSGAGAAAEPVSGWFWHADPDKDVKLNILRLHDENQQDNPLYQQALINQGYSTNGLFFTSRYAGTSILCARCHSSNALPPVPGEAANGVSRMSVAMHAGHAAVLDPETGLTLNDSANRAACYRCHPGSSTLCLRGAMGTAVDQRANLSMQCQSCHGSMQHVGSALRTDWLDQPNCQACHTGTATDNNGLIRYLDAFEGSTLRVATNNTFATSPNTPANGFSLYRFSQGHGGLQCSACHGSPHAIYPSFHGNDNLQNQDKQGQAGTLGECTVCHSSFPSGPSSSYLAGPHGMHRTGSAWITEGDNSHKNALEKLGIASCRACHGSDDRGTVLSAALTDQTLIVNSDSGGQTRTFWQGSIIGCYSCHQGTSGGDSNPRAAATVGPLSTTITANDDAVLPLVISNPGSNPLFIRVITPPQFGLAGISNNTHVIYRPFEDFVGTDSFTFAAYNTEKESNLATATVTVVQGLLSLHCLAVVPSNGLARADLPFWSYPELINGEVPLTQTWSFGDGSMASNSPNARHAYVRPGAYAWQLVTEAAELSCTNSGVVTVGNVIADRDEDGIDDDWELLTFKDLSSAHALSDFDKDGSLDYAECMAGTDAKDASSVLRIKALLENPAGGMVLHWASTEHRSYQVLASSDLPAGSFSCIASNLVATAPSNSFEDVSAAGESFRTFKLELE